MISKTVTVIDQFLSEQEFKSCFEPVLDVELKSDNSRFKVISLLRNIFGFDLNFLGKQIPPCSFKCEMTLPSNISWRPGMIEKNSYFEINLEKNKEYNLENDFILLQKHLNLFSSLANFNLFWREKEDNIFRQKLKFLGSQIDLLHELFCSKITENHQLNDFNPYALLTCIKPFIQYGPILAYPKEKNEL